MADGPEISLQLIACRARLREAATRIVGCRQHAEDVVQDAYVKLATADVQAEHALRYAFRLVRNLAIDRYRRSRFEAHLFAADAVEGGMPARAASPEYRLMHAQQLQLVAQALDGLPERTRTAFELHRLGGQTQRQVAARLGISAALANGLIREATTRCRAALDAA